MNRFSEGIQWIGEIHPQLPFCRAAAAVKITRGKGLLREKKGMKNFSQLFLGDHPLYSSHVDMTGSFADIICLGCAKDRLPMPSAERVNSRYEKLSAAIETVQPLLNLMENGLYLIGDFDLFPVQKNGKSKRACFWNLPDSYGGYWPYPELAEWTPSEYERNTHPLYPIPTQPAKLMNPERVQTYRKMLHEDPDGVPRAIGLYLRGSAVLLLDGHHKTLAAAAEGLPAKTLVIVRLENEKSLYEAGKLQKRFYLRRRYFELTVCDSEETFLCPWRWFGEKKEADTDSGFFSEEPTEESWGRIDDSLLAETRNPGMMEPWILRSAAEVEISSIKSQISRLQGMPPQICYQENKGLLMNLLNYDGLNPGNKWITPAQRDWLRKMLDHRF